MERTDLLPLVKRLESCIAHVEQCKRRINSGPAPATNGEKQKSLDLCMELLAAQELARYAYDAYQSAGHLVHANECYEKIKSDPPKELIREDA